MEKWKPIDWIPGLNSDYEVSNKGRVRRIGGFHNTFQGKKYIRANRMLKLNRTTTGYLAITLYPFGEQKRFYVHDLVAGAFLQKECGKDIINHIDENKTNNSVENLERCDVQYNVRYSHYKIHHPQKSFRKNSYGRNITNRSGKFEVKCYHDGKGKYIGRFDTLQEARVARNEYLESIGLLDYLTENEIALKE